MTPKAKSWTIGIVSFIAGVIVTIIGFVVLTIYVSFIREADMTDEEVTAAEQAQRLEAIFEDFPMHEPFHLAALETRSWKPFAFESIPVGSWWTDGDIYFKVLANDADSLYLVGTNREDCGMELLLRRSDEHVYCTDGASVFAFHHSPVTANQIQLADGAVVQMLVAYYDSTCIQPQAVLQRYHGRGLEHQKVIP